MHCQKRWTQRFPDSMEKKQNIKYPDYPVLAIHNHNKPSYNNDNNNEGNNNEGNGNKS